MSLRCSGCVSDKVELLHNTVSALNCPLGSIHVFDPTFSLGPPREVPYGRDRFYQTYSSAAVPSDEPRYCGTDFSLVGSYPRGFAEKGRDGFDSIATLLENEQMTRTGCLQSCCALGPQRCRYVWVFKTKCFAINCSSYPSNCEPVSVPNYIAPSLSLYIHVHYNSDGTLLGNPPPPTSMPPDSVATSSYQDSPLRAIITPSNTETHNSEVYLSAKNSSATHQVNMTTRGEEHMRKHMHTHSAIFDPIYSGSYVGSL